MVILHKNAVQKMSYRIWNTKIHSVNFLYVKDTVRVRNPSNFQRHPELKSFQPCAAPLMQGPEVRVVQITNVFRVITYPTFRKSQKSIYFLGTIYFFDPMFFFWLKPLFLNVLECIKNTKFQHFCDQNIHRHFSKIKSQFTYHSV